MSTATASPCTALTTNGTLQSLVTAKYPNASLEPSESVASASVAEVWGAVCSSPTLVSAYDAQSNLSFVDSVFIADSNGSGGLVTSGSLFVQFSLAWSAACPSGGGPYPAGFPCDYSNVWTGNLTTAAIVGPISMTYSQRYAGCDLLAKNASLALAVEGFYPDAHLHPSEIAAEQVVQVVWGEICSSWAFYQAYNAHPPQNFGESQWVSGAGSNQSPATNESLFVGFDFNWNAACPAGNSSYPSGSECQYDTGWSANLSSGTWSGPHTRFVFNTPLGGGPRFSTGPSPASPTAVWPWIAIAGALVGTASALVSLFWGRRRKGSTALPPAVADPISPTTAKPSMREISPPRSSEDSSPREASRKPPG